ncbi:MAG TPA: peptidoglycan DD-metalloendopeptidase family protein [Dissulfurispiraceae bacterium]|nr:peptidoglycan DD-metalloendopeptidase family protein [Dissulfurispiraceae bacterium]
MMRKRYAPFFVKTAIPIICAMLLLLSVAAVNPECEAANAREDYNKVQRDLRKQKKKLVQATKIERSVIVELQRIDERLNELNGRMSNTKKQISELKRNIASLETDISANSKNIMALKARLKTRIRTLWRINAEKEVILMLISDEDPSTIMRTSRSLTDIAGRYNKSIMSYREEVDRLNAKKMKLSEYADKIKAEERELQKMEDSAKKMKKEKETILAGVRRDKETYQHMIQELKDDADRLMTIIKESERKEKSGVGRKRTRTPQTVREELPSESPFTRLKGQLPWPVGGRIAIKYGSQVDPIFNLPVFRSGIHIKAAAGTRVAAVYDGRVVYASDLKGYGKLVVVSHGDSYHTLYGNLSKIFLSNGAIIKEGEAVGEVGESTTLGSSGLYFEIRYKGKPLDPQQWLGRSGGK